MNLEMRNVTVSVRGHDLLSDVSILLPAGSRTAVIGPNGAGKSTLLATLAGDVKPSAGEVRIGGEQIHLLSPRKLARTRSVLAQTHTTDVAFSVQQAVAMGRFPYRFDAGVSSEENRMAVDGAIADLDVESLRDRQVRSLSGGERQRTAIARVLAQSTPIVLLDEPTTALDIRHQESVMALVDRLHSQQRTIVAVLHDLNVVSHFDRVILLSRGTVAAQGKPADVLTSELLSSVYEYPIDVVPHPTDDRFLILPQRRHP
ncbi:MAG: heme ABC transporter ATP-binding protein [Actinomycetota bacterium]